MSIRKRLSEFYVAQGLTGKHLRKALQWDMRAVRANIANPVCNGCNRYTNGLSLSGAFIWSETPQGLSYWSARFNW